MRVKSWAAVLALVAVCDPTLAQDSKGKLIFSVEEVEWSLRINEDGSRGPKEKTGVFYYLLEGPGEYGSTMTGYKFREGEVVEASSSGGVETTAFLRQLNALPLSTFDVEKEMEVARKELRARNGPVTIVMDGSKYRIRYDFNGSSIDYTAWNPGPYIDSLAPYSGKLLELKAVIDLFARHFGRRQFGL